MNNFARIYLDSPERSASVTVLRPDDSTLAVYTVRGTGEIVKNDRFGTPETVYELPESK